METILAKALYDNTAESPDELAFHKGDVVVVIEQTVEGSVGWWKCSLHGQEGLAPANRLRLLSPSESIYQIPRPSQASPTYEVMERFYKVSSHSPVLFPWKSETLMVPDCSSPNTDVYAVPTLARKGTLYTPRPILGKASTTNIQKRCEMMNSNCTPCEIYDVPPPSKDLNYDIPIPSKNEPHLKLGSSYSTLPNRRKCEQIYDVPVALETPVSVHGFYGTMPSKGAHFEKVIYDTPPICGRPPVVSGGFCYDIPKCSEKAQQKSDSIPPEKECIYDTPPACVRPTVVSHGFCYDIPKCSEKAQQRSDSIRPKKKCIYDTPPQIKQRKSILNGLTLSNQKVINPGDSENISKPLEYRCELGPRPDHPRGCLSWGKKIMLSREQQEKGAITIENAIKNGSGAPVSENQRDSTVSTSSTTSSSSRSSCDSLFGSPSPDPPREVTLSPEEVTQRLLQLQETVCQAVPKLMNFVSSHWRCRKHLGQHLQKIRTASEDVANSVTSFLNFALDIRGNAQGLTDSNLQARLQKQLSIIEDSGLILQSSMDALGGLGWSLDVLAQDQGQLQTPDQLDRFVMVARTLPEDMKRLVSIINANSKLLFRNSSKEPELTKNPSPPDVQKSLGKNEPSADTKVDDDYVQLQTKTEFEKQQQSEEKNNITLDTNEEKERKQASKPDPPSPDSTSQQPCRPVISDHCRLYFGAIRKAIAVLVSSLEEQQPPEKFISHSKLVIMVGQRLIDTLFGEARRRQDSQELLHKSNHLCALLKQLAVATKKAALYFPDQVAIQEAQDFAKELAQKAHHFRMSLES
ncbi:cas scaffolding protein family member 4 [Neoarius graeffei]|uniref:cas scaffolding protein family member 4 n=1 Tax=Neoarius graeffei TaxID=443677 RepID=UPI00298C6F88|nr:cas scaffolding protein family member 4 [Neoarius graeffei]